MPRKPPFTFAAFAQHVGKAMGQAHPIDTEIPSAMQDLLARLGGQPDTSLSSRLRGLKTLFDKEAETGLA